MRDIALSFIVLILAVAVFSVVEAGSRNIQGIGFTGDGVMVMPEQATAPNAPAAGSSTAYVDSSGAPRVVESGGASFQHERQMSISINGVLGAVGPVNMGTSGGLTITSSGFSVEAAGSSDWTDSGIPFYYAAFFDPMDQ